MTPVTTRIVLTLLLIPSVVLEAWAQFPGAKGQALRLQVVFERTQKDKKVTSVPYTMSLVSAVGNEPALGQSRMRMVFQVPMYTETLAEQRDVGGATRTNTRANVVYKDVGDAIDCYARTRDDGRFLVQCSFEQSSVAPSDSTPIGSGGPPTQIKQGQGPPVVRTFRSEAALLLADGQTVRHGAGVDRFTGETVSVDVTLTVIK
jgi:hypothetical protein